MFTTRWLCPYQTGYSGPAQMEIIPPTGYSLSTNTMDQVMSLNNTQGVVGVEQIEERIIIQYKYVSI